MKAEVGECNVRCYSCHEFSPHRLAPSSNKQVCIWCLLLFKVKVYLRVHSKVSMSQSFLNVDFLVDFLRIKRWPRRVTIRNSHRFVLYHILALIKKFVLNGFVEWRMASVFIKWLSRFNVEVERVFFVRFCFHQGVLSTRISPGLWVIKNWQLAIIFLKAQILTFGLNCLLQQDVFYDSILKNYSFALSVNRAEKNRVSMLKICRNRPHKRYQRFSIFKWFICSLLTS